MEIPRLMLVTHHNSMQPNFSSALEMALRGGARWIQLREPEMSPLQVLAAAEQARKLCTQFEAKLSINATHEIQSDYVHFPQRFLDLPNLHTAQFGFSVHDLTSAQRAQQIGASYLLFGHVFSTLSHDAKPVGLEALREICANVNIPVLAIGGVSSQNIGACLEAGAYGVAVMRSVWSGDVESNVRQLLTALDK